MKYYTFHVTLCTSYILCGGSKTIVHLAPRSQSPHFFLSSDLTQTQDKFTIPPLVAQTAEPGKVEADRGSVSA